MTDTVHNIDREAFVEALGGWFNEQKRDLPWRESRDDSPLREPYFVWVSEIMLQQTQVATVVPYFETWIERFPTIEDLASAELEDVLSAWQGLGYYRRARMLHEAAAEMDAIPETFADWLEVKGVGDYTAAAIASLAFGEPVAAVDGNVTRVVTRLFAVSENVDKAAGKKIVKAHANSLISTEHPGFSNEAMMELGATICTPKRPDCARCPVNEFCVGQTNPLEYPVKNPRTRPKKWAPWVLVPTNASRVGLTQGKDELLGGLWGFELFETREALEKAAPTYDDLGSVRHTFTHRDTTFHVVTAQSVAQNYRWVAVDSAEFPPMSVAMKKVLNRFLHTLET